MPDYTTNDPKGYMGDPRRGAAMGRNNRAPDGRTMDELQSDFVAACQGLDRALRLKEDRPADGFKARCWEAAAESFREEKEEIRALVKALEARKDDARKITLRRVRLDSGGYDSNGTYYGFGEPLYWAADESGEYDATFRARTRADAKAIVRKAFPAATFYN